jgi:organic radical activating enzyme
MSDNRDYFCTRKFTDISLNIHRRSIGTCCAEDPANINFVEMQQKNMFNLAHMIDERKMMLNNVRVERCSQSCWHSEDQGLLSLRLGGNFNKKIPVTSTVQQIDTLHLSMGNKCAMTCSYCNQDQSSAWFKDLQHNGPYTVSQHADQYSLSTKNLVLNKLNTEMTGTTKHEQILFDQICTSVKSVGTVHITGGETLLYSEALLKLLTIIPSTVQVVIITGLGVKKAHAIKFLDLIKTYPNVKLGISAENTHALHEFNRYGNTYKDFLSCLEIVKNTGIDYQFFSTLSNLTVFGYVDFVQWANKKIVSNAVTTPSFMQVQNLDQDSKKYLLEKMQANYCSEFDWLIEALQMDHQVTSDSKENLKIFLKEFSSRRKLSLDIFPNTFLKWLDINVVQ